MYDYLRHCSEFTHSLEENQIYLVGYQLVVIELSFVLGKDLEILAKGYYS
jgi:hypothetical protein